MSLLYKVVASLLVLTFLMAFSVFLLLIFQGPFIQKSKCIFACCLFVVSSSATVIVSQFIVLFYYYI